MRNDGISVSMKQWAWLACAAALVGICGTAAAAPPAAPSSARKDLVMKTYTYKTVGELKIQADVYRPDDVEPRPVLVWLHGGALMMGNKKFVQPDLLELARSEGYCLVSADYRLAPQAKLPEIIEDLRDFMKWVREKGPDLFHADASKVVVSGGSAGGKIVGYALFYAGYDVDTASRGVHLADLFVAESARRRGVGRALVAAVARECRRTGGAWIAWFVQRDNREARAFYRALGARQDDDIPLEMRAAELIPKPIRSPKRSSSRR